MSAFLAGGQGASCLVVQGEAGVGKTTLWRHGVEVARVSGFTPLLSRPLELDMRVPFAGLRDLLGSVLEEVLDALPDPQRRALDAALLLADPVGPPLDPGAIAFARGLTNREVAQELVLATHTVESALTQIYRKLDVRSRSALASRFAERPESNGA